VGTRKLIAFIVIALTLLVFIVSHTIKYVPIEWLIIV